MLISGFQRDYVKEMWKIHTNTVQDPYVYFFLCSQTVSQTGEDKVPS